MRIRTLSAVLLLLIGFLLPFRVQAAERTIIILVRHGETEYNVSGRFQGALDIPLNDNGLKQADLLAAGLKDVPIDIFISSPMKRAYVTTLKCAETHGMEIT